MPVLSFHCLVWGSVLLVLVCAEGLNDGLALLPEPLRSPGPLLDVPVASEEHEDVSKSGKAGLMETSQESSGFFSEDSEDGNNATIEMKESREPSTGIDERRSTLEPPSLPLSLSRKPSNSSSRFVPTAEVVDPEQWESDSESSGSPSPGTQITGLIGHAPATVPPSGENRTPQNEPEETADNERATQVPTAPEIGNVPSRGPLLQPEDSQHEDFEEGEEDEEEEEVIFPTEQEVDEWRYLTSLATMSPAEEGAELRHGATEFLTETELHDSQEAEQVICVDWSNLAGKGYVMLNMTDNYDCDDFRMENGERLLELLENSFSGKMNIPQGSWLIFLSKPSQHDHQLLMAVASQQEIIPPKDVLSMLGEIRRGLSEIGIQNYSTVSTCHSRPSQTRSDYGKLFIVLVIIGSVCVLIIASGVIYICWQRRLPKLKNMSHGEELHFVENGCHDNPTLDVTSDSQSEMQEKKHSANGMAAGGEAGSGWQVLVNKPGKPEEEEENQEEDTHL
ncbi:hypothetical protein DNTS_026658 [Danionella cerebrum]|uniref:Podocalyxin-like protein 2 n=1 Tax=Danionella cerebrum TaxID=2873325 RepID=A0A553P8V6_9TELE|nr:hypothetical protein DNTS_026658 [Danionella translucida]TRY74100.1 hypothetical protein DNTS_026658 [Danionella translucida]